jgi:hypothetical protein
LIRLVANSMAFSNRGMERRPIDAVLAELDEIIGTCERRRTADGYFAALYRRVTAEVKARIDSGAFDDGTRMEQFDVVFARRYIEAWRSRERGDPVTGVWSVALDCSRDFWPVVMQHLLLGMNAHINLDLGIAAASVAPGSAIHSLKRDFDAINGILGDMVDEVQDRLAQIWPAMRWLDRTGGVVDEAVVNFSIRRAREHAWSVATALAGMPSVEEREAFIRDTDASMAALGQKVRDPGIKLRIVLGAIRLRERGTVATKLDALFD